MQSWLSPIPVTAQDSICTTTAPQEGTAGSASGFLPSVNQISVFYTLLSYVYSILYRCLQSCMDSCRREKKLHVFTVRPAAIVHSPLPGPGQPRAHSGRAARPGSCLSGLCVSVEGLAQDAEREGAHTARGGGLGLLGGSALPAPPADSTSPWALPALLRREALASPLSGALMPLALELRRFSLNN